MLATSGNTLMAIPECYSLARLTYETNHHKGSEPLPVTGRKDSSELKVKAIGLLYLTGLRSEPHV